jgi:hypothetical protein
MEDHHRLQRIRHRHRQLHLMLFPIDFRYTVSHQALYFAAAGGGFTDPILDTLQSEDNGLLINGLTNITLVRTGGSESASTPNALLTYTSPSAKYLLNSSQVLTSASTIRTEYDGSGTALGILVEEARTNLCLQSEDFATTWTNSSSTESVNQIAAPDGNTTADAMFETASSNFHFMQQAGISYTSGLPYTASAYIKKLGRQYMFVSLGTRFPASSNAYFNLDAGSVHTLGAGATRAAITSVGNGWYRCEVTATANATGTGTILIGGIADNGTSDSYAGDITKGFYAWGMQVENGAHASSYIATTTGTVTRAADQISLATGSFPWSGTNGMLVVKARPTLANQLGAAVSVNDGSGAEEIVLYRDASGNLVYQVEDGGANQLAPLDSTANAANLTAFTMAAAYKVNDFALSAGGAAAQTDTGGTLPTVTSLEVGANQADNYFNGHVQFIKYVPRDVSDANLVSDSAL